MYFITLICIIEIFKDQVSNSQYKLLLFYSMNPITLYIFFSVYTGYIPPYISASVFDMHIKILFNLLWKIIVCFSTLRAFVISVDIFGLITSFDRKWTSAYLFKIVLYASIFVVIHIPILKKYSGFFFQYLYVNFYNLQYNRN